MCIRDRTICLAVSPALKAYGIPGRARLFEVVQLSLIHIYSDAVDEFCVKLSGRLKNIIVDREYSASIGMTTGDDRELTFKDLYYEADQAMHFIIREYLPICYPAGYICMMCIRDSAVPPQKGAPCPVCHMP